MSFYPWPMNPPWPGPMPPAYPPGPGPMHPGHHPHFHGPQAPHYHEFCHSCCHPMHQCVCGCRECRKEAKELLVAAQQQEKGRATARTMAFVNLAFDPSADEKAAAEAEAGAGFRAARLNRAELAAAVEQGRVGTGLAYIGGGCCVHLSVEYTMISKASMVAVMVMDSEGTVLAWGKFGSDPGYYIKEDIITTNPGAALEVTVVDAIARVRWCEVFSC